MMSTRQEKGVSQFVYQCNFNSPALKNALLKKKRKFSTYLKEIQPEAVAKSYMRKGFLIYEEMRKYFVIYEDAVSHI